MEDRGVYFDVQPTERLRFTWSPTVLGAGPVLNLGAGQCRFTDSNIEIHNHGWELAPDLQIAFDLVKPWPVDSQAYSWITAFHVLEHIPISQVLKVCQEAYRCIKPGGIFMVEVPDTDAVAKEMLEGNYGMLECNYGMDYSIGYNHRWGYTRSSLQMLLKLAGFDRTWTGDAKCYHREQQGAIRCEGVRDGREDRLSSMQGEKPDHVSEPRSDAPGEPLPGGPVHTSGYVST